MICPDCDGRKQVFAFIHLKGKCGAQWINCSRCNGIGEVPDWHAAAIQEGTRRRNERLSRDMSLREEARRLGISRVELSAIERGLRPAPQHRGEQ